MCRCVVFFTFLSYRDLINYVYAMQMMATDASVSISSPLSGFCSAGRKVWLAIVAPVGWTSALGFKLLFFFIKLFYYNNSSAEFIFADRPLSWFFFSMHGGIHTFRWEFASRETVFFFFSWRMNCHLTFPICPEGNMLIFSEHAKAHRG